MASINEFVGRTRDKIEFVGLHYSSGNYIGFWSLFEMDKVDLLERQGWCGIRVLRLEWRINYDTDRNDEESRRDERDRTWTENKLTYIDVGFIISIVSDMMDKLRTLRVNGESVNKDLDEIEIVFGPHHRVSIFDDENGNLVIELIYTHHGVRFKVADSIPTEFEKAIYTLRDKFPENVVD